MQVTNDKAIVQFAARLASTSSLEVALAIPRSPLAEHPARHPTPRLAAGTQHATLKRRSTHPNLAVGPSPARSLTSDFPARQRLPGSTLHFRTAKDGPPKPIFLHWPDFQAGRYRAI
jgi:hypothetical protein